MNFPFEKLITDEHGTNKVADQFAGILHEGDIVALNGNLGSGKTFFVKRICSKFGIDNVTSPSFAIVNEYQNGKHVNHFDFYRIKKEEELFDLGFEEYLSNLEAITFIEWANLIPDILPSKRYEVNFEILSGTERKITINKL